MSKAIIEIEKPKRCKDCVWYQADAWFGGACVISKDENGWSKTIGADKEYDVQKWCPLLPKTEAIPIEWIRKWRKDKWFSNEPLEKRMIMAMGVRLMLEDWEEAHEQGNTDN